MDCINNTEVEVNDHQGSRERCNDGCGPIQYPKMQVNCTEVGIQTKDYVFTNSNVKTEPWSATWIWLNRNEYPEFQMSPFTIFCSKEEYRFGVALFRKEVILENKIQKAVAWVSGDRRYRLYINGKIAGRGPTEAGGDYGNQEPLEHWFYDYYDLTCLFKLGQNVIAAEVTLDTDVQADYSMGRGGFLMEVELTNSEGQLGSLKTDNTWQGILGKSYISYQEYDARKGPIGWRDVGYNDQHWPFVDEIAAALQGPWNLIPREFPPLWRQRFSPKRL